MTSDTSIDITAGEAHTNKMEVIGGRAPCSSDMCRVVLLGGAGYFLVAAGVIAFVQAGVAQSFCIPMCLLVFLGGVFLLLATARRWMVSDEPGTVNTKTDNDSQLSRPSW